MKKIIIVLFLLCFVPFFGAQAHETKQAGSISLLLHIDPDDEPVAGDQTWLYFAFNDTQNKFNINDCNCSVSITDQAGNSLLQKAISKDDYAVDWGDNVARVAISFPSKAVYEVTMTSQSKTNAFQQFSLKYDVRVDKDKVVVPTQDVPKDNSLRNYYIIGGAIIVLGIITYEVINRSRNK